MSAGKVGVAAMFVFVPAGALTLRRLLRNSTARDRVSWTMAPLLMQ
jgi:hypothetical protein